MHIIPEVEDAQPPPSKRIKRGPDSEVVQDAERVGSGALATTSGQPPARPMRPSRTNPIDHIFQFHKVSLHVHLSVDGTPHQYKHVEYCCLYHLLDIRLEQGLGVLQQEVWCRMQSGVLQTCGLQKTCFPEDQCLGQPG